MQLKRQKSSEGTGLAWVNFVYLVLRGAGIDLPISLTVVRVSGISNTELDTVIGRVCLSHLTSLKLRR